jgi:hypothetical protein
MEKLSSRDLESVNNCIQQLYGLCTLSEFPRRVMGLLEELVILRCSIFNDPTLAGFVLNVERARAEG